jgi:hypothetical protein
MARNSIIRFCLVLSAAILTACGGETADTGPTGLDIRFEAVNDGQAPCQIRRIARVDQALHSLYMVRGEGNYRLSDGQTRNIPVQIQFRGMDGVVSDEVITSTDFDATCDQVAIEWVIEYCQNQAREQVECPEFQVTGVGELAEFTLGFESP